MNDEVSVAALLEREGWTEADPRPKGRMRVLAVMMAVVMGCGLAALLVHLGAADPQADSPALIDVPHGPTGGLAGGGVPSNPSRTEKTDSATSVVVTNQASPLIVGVPWATTHSATKTETVTVTGSSVTSTANSKPETTTTTSAGPTGGNESSTAGTTPPPTTIPSCRLIVLFC
ncbi:MAG TPA: hypothetical protein VJ870_10125 [Amycolatopsis sp.]|nr:hypothetical protein [Amycolatopsis sp.]